MDLLFGFFIPFLVIVFIALLYKLTRNISGIIKFIINLLLIMLLLLSIICVIMSAAYIIWDFQENKLALEALKDYQPTINYIKRYKNENEKYPADTKAINPKSESLPFYIYTTFNNEKDFILEVRHCEISSKMYRYCSKKELEHCDATIKSSPDRHFQLGDWVVTKFPD
ncbi:MAG: hypothetical protein LBK53_09255 [Heliobacteriaceae bacterium]|jgi:predicted membrane protein|nr:hypothetical protein [Heliobacteriaceae bacterium]